MPQDLDRSSLSDPAATTIVYMPVKTLAEFAASAIAAGLDPTTPAVLIARTTRPDERVLAATIATLPERLAVISPAGPVVVMIGRVFADIDANWDMPQQRGENSGSGAPCGAPLQVRNAPD